MSSRRDPCPLARVGESPTGPQYLINQAPIWMTEYGRQILSPNAFRAAVEDKSSAKANITKIQIQSEANFTN